MRLKYNIVTRRENGISYLRSIEDPEEFMVSSSREGEVLEEAYWRIERSRRGKYVRGQSVSNRKKVSLHQFLTGYTGKIIDHKNRNTLDNTDENLEISSTVKNRINSNDLDFYQDKDVGVYFNKSKNVYVAQIQRDGKNITIASRRKRISALVAYDNYILINNLENPINCKLGKYSYSEAIEIFPEEILKKDYPKVFEFFNNK